MAQLNIFWWATLIRKPNIRCQLFRIQLEILDIIIVGAGLSGLTTAFKLRNRDPTLKIRILEATEQIGGQLCGTHLHDLSGKWFTEEQSHLYNLLMELKVPVHTRVAPPADFKVATSFNDSLFDKMAQYELQRYLNELDLRVRNFKPTFKILSRKSMSMKSHIYGRLFFTKSRKYMTNLVLLISGVDAEHIKFIEFIYICYTWGSLKRYITLFLDVPDNLLQFQSVDLLDMISKEIEGVEILYGHQINEINHLREYVEMRDTSNQSHYAYGVVLAVPWNNLQEIYFVHPIPKYFGNMKKRNSTRNVITSFLAEYADCYWRKKQFSGNYVCIDPFIVTYEYKYKVLTGYFVHEEYEERQIRSILLLELAKKFGDEMLRPIFFYQRTYKLHNTSHLPMTKPWNRIVWSSSASAGTCFRGCLDGAVQSGTRAAVNALLLRRPQMVTWQDIVEYRSTSNLHREEVGYWSVFLSSFNIKNVGTYTIFISSLLLLLNYAYKMSTS